MNNTQVMERSLSFKPAASIDEVFPVGVLHETSAYRAVWPSRLVPLKTIRPVDGGVSHYADLTNLPHGDVETLSRLLGNEGPVSLLEQMRDARIPAVEFVAVI